MIANITHNKKNVFVIASTNDGKSLTYQSIFEVIGSIVLVISLTIALIKD